MAAIEFNNSPLKTTYASSLKAYYRFGSGALTTDSSGNVVTLTNNNTVGEDTGVFGGAADLGTANTNKYFSAVDNLGLIGTSDLTISVWVRMNTEIGTSNQMFVFQSTSTSDVTWQIWYDYNAGTRRIAFTRDRYGVGSENAYFTTTLGTTWHHLVLTHTSGLVKGYLDGQLVTSVVANTGNGGDGEQTGGSYGAYRSASSFASCDFDDLAILGTVLSADQVKELYEGRSVGELHPAYSANLQGLWHLSGTTDSSANGYNLTNNGTSTFVPGKFSNSVNLVAASSQFLSIADASCPNLEISGSQTWLCWVYPNTQTNYQTPMSKVGATNLRRLLLGTSGDAFFTVSGLTTNTQVANLNTFNPVVLGRWNLIVGIYDSVEAKLKIFINGLKSEVTASGSATDTDAVFNIGKHDNTNPYYWNGLVDEAAIWSRAWSDAEVVNYYAWAKGLRSKVM